MSSLMKSRAALAGAALASCAAAALVVPALSSGHATVSPLQPQGTPLTGARGTYVVRAPNEREAQSTWKIVMIVPAAVQESISVRQDANWKIRIFKQDTGKTAEGGGKVFAVRRISWTAKTRDAEIEPGMFGEWPVRFVNPATPTTLCFGIAQYYRNVDGTRRKPEIVNWTGDPATADTPRSCFDIAAAPPKP
ncbi:MAG: hypothetical protein QOI48_1426 [Solirubrobacteraceae bacterium]|jgi:hypothetical protein|nr:hypothetical protein [Solirubrobacteraceae bacterium]